MKYCLLFLLLCSCATVPQEAANHTGHTIICDITAKEGSTINLSFGVEKTGNTSGSNAATSTGNTPTNTVSPTTDLNLTKGIK